MKKTSTLVILLLFCAIIVKAQALHSFNAIDLGAGLSMNTAAGDAETLKSTQSFHVNANYNLTPYVNFIGEFQSGSLAGGDVANVSGRQFLNRFNALAVRGQVQLGQLVGNNMEQWATIARNMYVGGGVGLILNDITKINRESSHFPEMKNPGLNNSINMFVPVRIGYEFKILDPYKQNRFKLDLAYTHNFIMGDDIDGFAVGRYKDAISQFSLGFKVCLFGTKWYRQNL